MAKLVKWLQERVVETLDPDRQQRLESLEQLMWSTLAARYKQGQPFRLEEFHQAGHSKRDLQSVSERLYKRALGFAWQDEQISSAEDKQLAWVARSLELPDEQVAQLNEVACLEVVGTFLASAMDDGQIDDGEARRLTKIASAIHSTPGDIVRKYFQKEGAHFLQAVFLRSVEDNWLDPNEWESLLRTTTNLGLTVDELLQAIMPQAHDFVEHVLADSRADGVLTEQEENTLLWLLGNLRLPPRFQTYAAGEIGLLKQLTDIRRRGVLPSCEVPAELQLRAGEILHLWCGGQLIRSRQLKSGPRIDRYDGQLAITDSRLLFVSQQKPLGVTLRSIISWTRAGDGALINTKSRSLGTIRAGVDARLYFAILDTAIGRANQTITQTGNSKSRRHISRATRQRIWQRYGGRCVDCGATDYLEFDHIIPVAKGGSNSENNIQLLCRRCNLQKSDRI